MNAWRPFGTILGFNSESTPSRRIVRRAYEWSKGTYMYRVVRMDEEIIDGTTHTWVGAFVYSHEKDEHVFIGALRFKAEDLVLSKRVASFVEVYGHRIPVMEG
jgi:hypothetical protein